MEKSTIQPNEDSHLHYAEQFEQGLITFTDYLTAYYQDLISRGETPEDAQLAVQVEKARIDSFLFGQHIEP